MNSFRAISLCVLMAVTVMGRLVWGLEAEEHSVCSTCPESSCGTTESFTVRNALSQGNSDLRIVCHLWDECGGFSTYSADIPCKSVEVNVNHYRPAIDEVVCEFIWTQTNVEKFIRSQAVVWSRASSSPKKTYYVVTDSDFWFSDSPDGTLTKIGSWTGFNYLSSETIIMGTTNGKIQGFGRDHCRTRA